MKNFVWEIEELSRPHVHIKDKNVVNQKLSRLIEDGFKKLQVVSDFDKTLTKQHENGKLHLSSFAMFSTCPSVTQEHKVTADELNRKYAPYEVDPTIPQDVKVQLMIEWWTKSEEILKGLSVTKDEIERVCGELCPSLRDGTKELFESLEANNVPILVFSAGLGDTVVAVLKHCQVYLSNVEVVSNFLKYNNNGIIEGFQNLVIHIYNKNEVAIKGTHFYHRIMDKENALLMGDSLGDASMVDGMENVKEVLKIGFLYERSEESLPSYMDTFDIVLVDDQTMDIPRAIIDLIKSKQIQGDCI
ncbi:7-methylguanosine phosphate-specific 5'-nucleotidase-like [Diorhabda sublineata]|uniref:7-methylguanosine phosphate-specific 5'-nucleotidase-like n=1 Tax=Diorhabda sublineata TaxID=1163346 RepID=UPI0024E10D54|nr:7-methylguanosine phosphate-specific 5'-nucleotidase-like [Diorhabda sublineata]